MSTTVLRTTAERYPNELAFASGDHKVTYQDLLLQIDQHATRLSSSRVGQGDRIVWCPQNDLETLTTFWSLFELGAVACPISHRFPQATQTEIQEQLAASRLPLNGPLSPSHRGLPSTGMEAAVAEKQPATVILSSGSSGQPKAIVHSLAAHVASAEGAATNIPLGTGDRWLWSLPAYHVSGFSILIRCASAGATVVGMEESTALTAQLLREANITHLSLVGTQLLRLLEDKSFPHSSLKAVLLGGSASSASLVSEARCRGVPVHTTYGLTETASQVTTSSVFGDPASSGHVLPLRELRIADSGEILVKGDTLCLGYLRSGTIDAVVDREGWFHTGDVGRIDTNGELFVTGRKDNMFVSGGENIFPETIERALQELPGIEQAIVVPRADKEFVLDLLRLCKETYPGNPSGTRHCEANCVASNFPCYFCRGRVTTKAESNQAGRN